MKRISCLLGVLAALSFSWTSVTAETLLFSHNFGGSSEASLDGVALDVGGQNWFAGGVDSTDSVASFNADGSVTGQGSMWVNFTPQAGFSYTLSADITATNNQWIALGFAQNPGAGSGAGESRHTGDANGIAWALHRFENNNPDQQFFVGPSTTGGAINNNVVSQTMSMVITLDAIDSDNVLASLSLNGAVQANVDELNIGSLAALGIQGLGFSSASGTVSGSIDNFSLTAIPEPSTYALMFGVAVLGIALCRRRRG